MKALKRVVVGSVVVGGTRGGMVIEVPLTIGKGKYSVMVVVWW